MEVDAFIGHLRHQGVGLAAAAQVAGWSAPVPRTDWTVRELVKHVGGVHRWAADVVRTGAGDLATEAGRRVGEGPDDDELLAWYLAGHADLLAALGGASPDLTAATFLSSRSPLEFWARRQAHETAIHRADAEAATGRTTRFPVDLAQDGIDELLCGFAARKRTSGAERGTLLLGCSDGPSWSVTFGGEDIGAERVGSIKDGDVSGTSSGLYLWLWNRDSAVVADASRPLVRAWPAAVAVTWT